MIKTFLSLPVLLRVYLGITAVMSIIALLTFGIDKLLSKTGISLGPLRFTFRRVPERTLLTLSMLGGSFGAMIGMLLFRHKTRKDRFRILIPIHVIIWVLIGLAVIDYGPKLIKTLGL